MLTLKKRILFYCILILAPVVGAVILGEVYVRLTFDYDTPDLIQQRRLQYEQALFARHVFPPKEQLGSGWNEGAWFINAKGYRGRDFSVPKPPGTVRIMIYGGSAVFDPAATRGADWPHRVESILQEAGLSCVEVINAGIPGHASFDSFGRLFAEGHLFDPDYVVLYNAWNDLKYFRFTVPILRFMKPHVKEQDPFAHYRNAVDRALCRTSQLYFRLRDLYYARRLRRGLQGPRPITDWNSKVSHQSLRQFKINVEMFVALAKLIGAKPVLMTQARLATEENTSAQKWRLSYDYVQFNHEELLRAFKATDTVIHEVAETRHVALIDSARKFNGRDELFSDEVHLTETGSKELARFVAAELKALLKGACHKIGAMNGEEGTIQKQSHPSPVAPVAE